MEQILAIHQQHFRDPSNVDAECPVAAKSTGFLMGAVTRESLADFCTQSETKVFVARGGENVAGCMIANFIPPEELQDVVWIDPCVRGVFLKNTKQRGLLYMEQIAVDKCHQRTGVSRQLLKFASSTLPPTARMHSFISIKPRLNEASISFHRQMGFQLEGFFQKDNFWGMKDYMSALFIR